ncbi:MAG: GxxExxY protein [Gemmatimonadaceae bacterium]|nr:GxxExxY protein [Gemmatimonadaceae bacterium]
MDRERASREIVDSAIKVHSAIGPGLLESAYLACLSYELRSRGCRVETQVALPVVYRQARLDAGYRIDMLVEGSVDVEIKAVTKLHAIHSAQLLSYLKLSGKKLGLLLNFHEVRMVNGIRRMVNNL